MVTLECHPDAMTPDGNPLLGPGAGGARVLDGGRAVAERLRRGGRDRKDDRGVDDRRRDRARRARDAGLAVRRRLPAAGPGGRGRARGLPLLLPAAVPGRPRRVGPAQPAERAARPAAGRGGGVRLQERLGAGRPPPPRAAVAPGRRRPARLRLDAAALVRGGGRGAPGVPGAGRDDRHVVVRQDRAGGPRRASAAGPGLRQPHRPAGRQRHLHPVPERPRRDRRRRDGDAAGRASCSGW